MSRRYTKADLEQIVSVQLENLNAMHDLLSIMKRQNELLNSANKKLKSQILNKSYIQLEKEIPKSEGGKIKLFWFFRGGLCVGKNQMCLMCGWLFSNGIQRFRLNFSCVKIREYFQLSVKIAKLLRIFGRKFTSN